LPFHIISSFPLHAQRAPGMKSPQRTIRVPFIGSSVFARSRVYHDSADHVKRVSSPRFANPAGLYIVHVPLSFSPFSLFFSPFLFCTWTFRGCLPSPYAFLDLSAILSLAPMQYRAPMLLVIMGLVYRDGVWLHRTCLLFHNAGSAHLRDSPR
jgi:hypothetical protein